MPWVIAGRTHGIRSGRGGPESGEPSVLLEFAALGERQPAVGAVADDDVAKPQIEQPRRVGDERGGALAERGPEDLARVGPARPTECRPKPRCA